MYVREREEEREKEGVLAVVAQLSRSIHVCLCVMVREKEIGGERKR